MSRIERLQSLVVLAAAVTGVVLGTVAGVGSAAERLVVPALIVLLVVIFLQVTPARLGDAIRRARVLGASLVINFLWTPVLAWLLGMVLLGGEPDLRLGLLLLLVTPCTDWFLVFTGLARGNVSLATALLPLNLVLQMLLLPFYILVLGGTLIPVDAAVVLEALLLVLLVPLVVVGLIRFALRLVKGAGWVDRAVVPRTGPVIQLLLAVAVVSVFAAYGDVALERPGPVLLVVAALAVFFAVNFLVAQRTGDALHLAHPERATLTMAVLARNSPVALAIAAVAFPDRPLIALALVAGPLVELPVLALVAQRLRGRGERPAPG